MPGVPGASPGGGTLDYKTVREKYYDFSYPQAYIELGGSEFKDKTKRMIINDINVELTCGFEASIARFRIYNVYDAKSGQFQFNDVKKQVFLGNTLSISLGYLDSLSVVFMGFVAGVSFGFDPIDLPYIEVTGMDAKGIMMSSCYAMQQPANNYGDAVREILQKAAYGNAIEALKVTDTPDKEEQSGGNAASAYTVEMVSESDYEFIVKAAKKFNFEFFIDRGTAYFRKAKSDTSVLMELGSGAGLAKFEIGYSLTGMVSKIEARTMDSGTGKPITSGAVKYQGTLFPGNKAKSMLSESRKVYIDPSISSKQQADSRAESLMENMSYRLCSLESEGPGIPELVPGRFIEVTGLGKPVDNRFYLTTVIHDYGADAGYKTRLIGKAATAPK